MTGKELENFRLAPYGEGPYAGWWVDKPHQLVRELCLEVERLQGLCRKMKSQAKRARRASNPTRT